MANVQIPDTLFLKLMEYFLLDEASDELFTEIAGLLDDKCQKMIKRQYYSAQFDESLTPSQRENARQLYLDMVGMHKDYRYSSKDRL